jgi:hypothetical protein
MSSPASHSQDFAAIVRARRRLITLTSVPFFVVAAVAILARIAGGRFLGIPFSVAGPISYIVFLATLAFHIAVWRCPACKAYLGLVVLARFCPKCGVRFDSDSGHEEVSPSEMSRPGDTNPAISIGSEKDRNS